MMTPRNAMCYFLEILDVKMHTERQPTTQAEYTPERCVTAKWNGIEKRDPWKLIWSHVIWFVTSLSRMWNLCTEIRTTEMRFTLAECENMEMGVTTLGTGRGELQLMLWRHKQQFCDVSMEAEQDATDSTIHRCWACVCLTGMLKPTQKCVAVLGWGCCKCAEMCWNVHGSGRAIQRNTQVYGHKCKCDVKINMDCPVHEHWIQDSKGGVCQYPYQWDWKLWKKWEDP